MTIDEANIANTEADTDLKLAQARLLNAQAEELEMMNAKRAEQQADGSLVFNEFDDEDEDPTDLRDALRETAHRIKP